MTEVGMAKKFMTPSELERLWDLYAAGDTAATIARKLGRPHATVTDRIRLCGGIRPVIPQRPARALSAAEREEISRGLAAGTSLRAIAARLGRPASTVSREVSRNGGRKRYRAGVAERAAVVRRRRPKASKL